MDKHVGHVAISLRLLQKTMCVFLHLVTEDRSYRTSRLVSGLKARHGQSHGDSGRLNVLDVGKAAVLIGRKKSRKPNTRNGCTITHKDAEHLAVRLYGLFLRPQGGNYQHPDFLPNRTKTSWVCVSMKFWIQPFRRALEPVPLVKV